MSSSSLPGASHSSGAASAVASSSRLTLDLDCPIPWPSAAAGDDDALPDAAAPRVALPLRYYETLWLGEVFSSLPTLVHASHTLLRHAPAGDVRTALLGLLRAPMPRTAGGLEERVRGTTHAQLVALLLHGEAPPDWSETEVHVVRAALRSGPGSAVAAEIRDQMRVRQERQAAAAAEEAQAAQEDPEEEESHGKLARRWLSAIGMRELQLQALTLLLLLQLHAEYPLPCTPGGGAASTPNTDEPAAEHTTPSKTSTAAARLLIEGSSEDAPGEAPAKKRRRKEQARRWTGSGASGFPWARPVGESSSPRLEDAALERGTSPASLTRRFEAIIDRLALLGVTASLSFDVAPVEVARKSSSKPAAPLHFGTAAREKALGDERDELQWLCADVVEPLFGRLLPRQVAALRARAFTPGLPGATPARPGRTRERSAVEATSSELDLVRLGAAQAKRLRAEEARERAARPKLEEALRSESQESARGRSMARGERFATREVSIGPSRSWERSNSVGVVEAPAAPEEPPRRLGPTLQAPARIDKRKSSAHRLDRAASQVLVSNNASSSSSSKPAIPTLPARSAAITGWRRAESQPAWPPVRPALGKPTSAPLFAETQPLTTSADALAWSDDEAEGEEMLPVRQQVSARSALARSVSARTPFARSESQPAHMLAAAPKRRIDDDDEGGGDKDDDNEMLVLRKRPKPRFSWTHGSGSGRDSDGDAPPRPLSALVANTSMRFDERSDASRSASPLPLPQAPSSAAGTSDAAPPSVKALPPRTGMAGRTASGRNPFAARRTAE